MRSPMTKVRLSRRAQALLAAAGMDGPACRWYVLTIAPGADIPVDNALAEAAIEHWMPTTKVKRQRHRGSRRMVTCEVTVPALPGYVFARVSWTDDAWHALRSVAGVDGIIGGAMLPKPLADREFELFRKRADEDEEFTAMLINALKLGDWVRIDAGPFVGFEGVVDALMGDSGRVKVETHLFGRATLVDLDVAQITKSD